MTNLNDTHDRMRLGGYVLDGPVDSARLPIPHGPAPGAPTGSCCAARAVLRDREAELLDLKGPCRVSTCRLHQAHSGPCDIRRPA